jgi:NTE family protein
VRSWRRLLCGTRGPALRLSLALQGGGAHGAFTWGVLDRLLEEQRVEIAAVSGTSAGAMNAVALAAGWCRDGRDGARACLRDFWRAVGGVGRGQALLGRNAFGAFAADLATHLLSPYELNPLRVDPLRALLERLVDFAALRRHGTIPLLIAATEMRTGRCRLFREHELTADMVLASACLPRLHHAVTIDGEPYWDGGFSKNPPVLALAELGRSERLLVVRIDPAEVAEPAPRAAAIRHRTAQLVFSRPLADELARLDELKALARLPLAWTSARLRRLRRLEVETIADDETLATLHPSTKIAPEMRLLEDLRDAGREAAGDWLRRRAES